VSLVEARLHDVKTGQYNADMDAAEGEKIFRPFMATGYYACLTEFEYESLFGDTFGILELYLEQGKFQYYMRTLATLLNCYCHAISVKIMRRREL